MPAVIVEAGLLGVALHHFDTGTDHKTAADLHICQLTLACGKSLVHQFREAATEAIIHPVAGLNGLGRLLGGDIFTLKFIQHSRFLLSGALRRRSFYWILP